MGELFEKIKVNSLKYKTSEIQSIPKDEFILPALTAGIQNQGLNNYVPKDNATILKNVITISANGANTGATFFQNKEFTVLQDAYAIKWVYTDDVLTDNNYLFLASAISKRIYGNYEWTNKAGWERIKSEKIHLPTQNGQIDFAFMENFIVELEERRIQEMEVERIVELEAYLRVTGLSDYILTEEERAVLEAFRSGKISWGGVKLLDKQQVKDIEWRVFRMEDVLEWQPQKEIDPLKLDKLKDKNQKLYPFYGQATLNNGIISYNQLVEEVLNNKEGKPTILIHSNNQNTIYLESPFYLKDGHGATSVLQSKKLNKLNALYFMSSIKKVILSKYSYNAKATKIELKNTLISLPSVQGKPLYDYMEVFIRAVQKLVIKDVVQYAERKVAATRAVVK